VSSAHPALRLGDARSALGTAAVRLWQHGPAQAGNLAYLSLLGLFPFFGLVVMVAGVLGRTQDGMRAIVNVLGLLPPSVAALLDGPVSEVVAERASGGLITFGVLVIFWTVTSYAEAVREIIRDAHGDRPQMRLWRYRALSLAVVLAAVLLMLAALAMQLLLGGAEAAILALVPPGALPGLAVELKIILPAASLFAGLCVALYGLTMPRHRSWAVTWPGALVIALGWILVTMAMPPVLAIFAGWSLAYGSLTGVIVTLIYFWLLGLWLVFGVHFNAALAKARQSRLKAEDVIAMD
jgi:membrane protein